MIARPLDTIRAAFARRRHTSLLLAIIFALSMRPLVGDTEIGPVVFSLALLLLLLLAVLTIRVDELIGESEVLVAQRRRHMIIAWTLAGLAIAERLYMISSPTFEVLRLGTIAWLLFFAFVIWSLLRNLLRHREVTGEVISMSISIYLLLGLAWGVLYALILEFQPDAFQFGGASLAITVQTEAHTLPILVYFSLTTISTVGFGDITPATMLARYAAVAEGITGQFYLAILVARLVGMQLARR